jgi:iron complex outermembrane receptor protein
MTTSIYPRRVSAGQRRGALRLACSATALALAAPAAAQTIMASAAAQAATDGVQIEEVVVSARRRKETIQETPVAVTSVSAAQMEAVGATEISDLHGAVPNLLFTPAVSGFQTANVSIRGLSFADNEKSFDPSVALVVDGVFQGSNTAQLMDNFDLASIEVLRGPQGTLFGRNTIGGVINVTRTRPTGAWGAKLGVDYGRFDTFSARAVVNVPLVEDKLAAKFSTSTPRPTAFRSRARAPLASKAMYRTSATGGAAATARTTAWRCSSPRPRTSARS